MTVAAADVQVRWLPGLGPSSPGGVELTALGPRGVAARVVTLPEVLWLCVLTDLFCPTSWYQTVTGLATDASNASQR